MTLIKDFFHDIQQQALKAFVDHSALFPLFESEQIVERFYHILRSFFAIDALALLDPEIEDWKPQFVFNFPESALTDGLPHWADHLVTQASAERQPIYTLNAETETDGRFSGLFEQTGFRTIGFLPIHTVLNLPYKIGNHQKLVQNIVLSINCQRAGAFSEKDLKFLLTLGHFYSNELLMTLMTDFTGRYTTSTLENIPYGILSITSKSVKASNRQVHKILSLKNDAASFDNLTVLFPTAVESGLQAAANRILSQQSTHEDLEFWHTTPDERTILIVCKMAPLDPMDESLRMLFRSSERAAVESAILIFEDGTARRERRRLIREMELASEVQMKLLPQTTKDIPGLEIATLSVPALEVGGDYFDIIHPDKQRVAFIIADVAGKGIPAAFRMAELKGIFQTLGRLLMSPKHILTQANRIIHEDWDREQFVSLAFAVIDVKWRTLELSRAGHEPVLLIREGEIIPLKPRGIALGLAESEQFETTLEEYPHRLHPNDLLVMYTDGLTESMNINNEPYGDKRFHNLLKDHGSASPETIINIIRRSIKEYVADRPQFDDITVIVIKVL